MHDMTGKKTMRVRYQSENPNLLNKKKIPQFPLTLSHTHDTKMLTTR